MYEKKYSWNSITKKQPTKNEFSFFNEEERNFIQTMRVSNQMSFSEGIMAIDGRDFISIPKLINNKLYNSSDKGIQLKINKYIKKLKLIYVDFLCPNRYTGSKIKIKNKLDSKKNKNKNQVN